MKEVKRLLPKSHLMYLGDTARVPYGIRSAETVTRYAMESALFLKNKGINMLVVACNTSTAVALDALSSGYEVPIIGVIEPGAKAAAAATRRGRVGVIGTSATIDSGAYPEAIRQIDAGISVVGLECPMFVPLIEEGWLENEVARLTAKEYLYRLYHMDSDIDTVVLGCTHYPLLKQTIQKVAGGIFEQRVTLVDSAGETAKVVKEEVVDKKIPIDEGGRTDFFVTDFPERFSQVGSMFLGEKIESALRVELPDCGA